MPDPVTIAVLAEKPSVARDIAAVLGASSRREGAFEGGGYVVTWAIGHLVGIAQPHEIDAAWKRWSFSTLPMLPREFPLVVMDETRDQFRAVKKILLDRAIDRIVCATDAGREGELIFRHIYEASGCKKPVSRLWISSLTPDAIRDGFRKLEPGTAYDKLADAARGRSRADWLVGMNLSRAYSLALDEPLSVGRVQTPTLAMLVEREAAIRSFVPEDYLEVVATFGPHPSEPRPDIHPNDDRYEGTWTRPRPKRPARSARAVSPTEKGSSDPASTERDAAEAELRRLPPGGDEARAIVERARTGRAEIMSVDRSKKTLAPPLLYDLTELQRHANRLYGMTAQQTLDTAQALYERHKLLSYPRTDSRHLSQAIAATLSGVVAGITPRYPGLVAPGSGERPLGKRFVDDARVSDHHAIIPTGATAKNAALNQAEERIFDLVCRRLLQAWHPDHIDAITRVVTTITNERPEPIVDRYESRGVSVEREGWKLLDIKTQRKAAKAAKNAQNEDKSGGASDTTLPAGLEAGQKRSVLDAKAEPHRTKPPQRFTEATLLTAMETAGRTLEERELSDAMKDLGLGTPATRAQIIETLLRREYVIRSGKSLEPTDKGMRLVDVVHPEVKSAAMTGEWEAKLRRLQRGDGDLGRFMESIEAYVREVVGRVGDAPMPRMTPPTAPPPRGTNSEARTHAAIERPSHAAEEREGAPSYEPSTGARADAGFYETRETTPSTTRAETRKESGFDAWKRSSSTAPKLDHEAVGGSPARHDEPPLHRSSTDTHVAGPREPTPPGELRALLQRSFGFDNFRPYQEAVCRAATVGHDLLLVMPTGAGKSLCYQLPGLARGGTTLVVSPLIALMDDQATKLIAQGFRAARIHSGRSRVESRQACVDYLSGDLDFLFIAPERLRVPGFPEMLARRKPSLVAIDEAHCISQWGHDFRPDYRLLGQRLPMLRPAPIVALTATATRDVQDDILEQLDIPRADRFIHGFRRDNIAIEVVELAPSSRPAAIAELLRDRARRPAIVYASTRKSAEAIAKKLGVRVAAYHAGMDADERERVQTAFLSGRLEVIVGTTAFGMGIDKANVRTVVHAALPGSVEGYYQEIGRAGRDGQPSTAVLMHSFVDRKTHEFFHERDYPDASLLESMVGGASKKPILQESLRKKVRIESEVFDKALEKLVAHGGIVLSADEETVSRGDADWKTPYLAQRTHKLAELERMARFASSHGCRMVRLVRHFGDQEDRGDPCGHCDGCAPGKASLRTLREPDAEESTAITSILAALARDDEQASGRLYRETFPDGKLDRRSFEHIVGGLARAGLVTVSETSFVKDGETIHYQRIALTHEGRERGTSLHGIAIENAPARAKPKKRAGKGRAKDEAPKSEASSDAQRRKWFFAQKGRRKKKGRG